MWYLPFETNDGTFHAFFSERGLVSLDFPGDPRGVPPTGAAKEALSDGVRIWALITTEALNKALAGAPNSELPPFDWTGHSRFRQEVWRALLRILPGETKTYSEIAAGLGKPGATRATGNACGANPIPVLVPCHRVVAAGGKLGGFSGGLDWKRRLLGREGVVLELGLQHRKGE